MNTVKNIFRHIFIDGLSGMATGLFATLIFGTILGQIGSFLNGTAAGIVLSAAAAAKLLMGPGIGVGVAAKFHSSPLVTVSAACAGFIGSFASGIISACETGTAASFSGVGEPLGAFVAAFIAIEIGNLISGKTKLDILLTPAVVICTGSAAGLLIGPPISRFMTWLGSIIMWATECQPIIMGVIIAVIMGIALTLPISSAALAVILGLSGIAGGAAVTGCCAQMIGFAVISYRENGFGGLVAQGIGTSMLQISNLVKKPILWLPPVIASAILGPVSTALLGMSCLPAGAGMGTSGLVGPILTYQSMTAAGVSAKIALAEIICIQFIAPAVISLAISEGMRKAGFIRHGDLSLDDIN